MFLSYLQEENKEYFLKVCVHAALANGVFAEEERETLAAYCREMNVKEHVPETPEPFSELVQAIFDNTMPAERNIFVLETLALVKSDGVYDEKERIFMSSLVNGLDVSDEDFAKMEVLLDKYTEIGKELYATIAE